MENTKPSNPRMHNPDGMYASEARAEDFYSLRDHFANSAMQGIISANTESFANGMGINFKNLAIESYEIADEMLKIRSIKTK